MSQMLKKPRSHNIRRHFREDAAFFLPFFRVVVEIIFAAGVISPRTNTVIEIVTRFTVVIMENMITVIGIGHIAH